MKDPTDFLNEFMKESGGDPGDDLKKFLKESGIEFDDEQMKQLDAALKMSKEEMDALAEKLGEGMHELSDGSLLQVGPPVREKKEITPETQEKLDKLLAKVDELIPPVETVRLKLSRGETTVFDSKMGGVPYFPRSMEYPTVREGEHAGKPLYFLAQLNFGSLPKIAGFPETGILQFFAGCVGDEFYGLDFDDCTDQNRFRVIFHENVTTDVSELFSESDMPDFEFDEIYFPFNGEFILTAEKAETMPATEYDFRFGGCDFKIYNELFNAELTSTFEIYNADRPLSEALYETRATTGTRMGGFPHFEQEDPRGYDDKLAGHTILLFQSDSDSGGEGWENYVCWGDAGVANFFITPEDLAKRDFSHVLYTWDCG